MGQKLDFALAILNGALGDHLVRTGNGLATEMAFVRGGLPVPPERLAAPGSSGHLAVFVHGLMCTESAWTFADGADYGALLQRDCGYAPLYLRYNSGRAIADNGAALDALLERVVASWPVPVEEVLLLGYSMGGLVVRAACHVASARNSRWLASVRRAIYVGTPHRGAPLERLGRLATRTLAAIPDPTTRLIGQIANLRSDGLKDLGDADLRHVDRLASAQRLSLTDRRHPVPLLPSIAHHLVASTLLEGELSLFFGDALVPVASATDGACTTRESLLLPPDHVRIVRGIAHVDLPRSPVVYEAIREWSAR